MFVRYFRPWFDAAAAGVVDAAGTAVGTGTAGGGSALLFGFTVGSPRRAITTGFCAAAVG